MGAITIKTILCKKVLQENNVAKRTTLIKTKLEETMTLFSCFLHILFTDSCEFILKKNGMYAILLLLYWHHYVFVG